jgi:hypothetical protein
MIQMNSTQIEIDLLSFLQRGKVGEIRLGMHFREIDMMLDGTFLLREDKHRIGVWVRFYSGFMVHFQNDRVVGIGAMMPSSEIPHSLVRWINRPEPCLSPSKFTELLKARGIAYRNPCSSGPHNAVCVTEGGVIVFAHRLLEEQTDGEVLLSQEAYVDSFLMGDENLFFGSDECQHAAPQPS